MCDWISIHPLTHSRGFQTVKAWRDLSKLPRELWILCFATLVNRLGTMALPFLMLYLSRDLGYSVERAGAALALYGGVAVAAGPIGGRLADRWGALRTIEGTLLASGVVLLLFPLAKSWPAIVVMTILFAATSEAFRPANLARVGELGPPESRKQAFVLSRLAVNLGMSVGPLLGGFLVQSSYPLLFIVDGLTTLSAAAILVLSSFHRLAQARERELLAAGAALPHEQHRGSLFSAVFADPALRMFLLGIIPVGMVFFQHESTMAVFMVRDLHLPESAYGALFTINTGMIILLEVPLNAATADWPHRRTLAVGSALFAVGFGALAIADSYLEVAATVVIWTVGEMVLLPGMSAYVAEIAPEGRRGEYMGLYMMAFSAAFMLGPWLGTQLLERFGATVLWTAIFGLGMLSALVLSRTPQTRGI